ncbi:hypothetical protein GCM10010401_05700 [Rarobacter faecitabidus]|uniref:Bifunctional folate synthesis protein n=1 Tax=Rarobacter faecitabidus TaxID=13243 RepID=A0A542ZTS6_RARFA|nr:2-amino-4-hydroxy-6-hydroxymethyldihydropteridine diphosphokinase [Rarobacter faecitabidus]TQL63679.1 dihydroneopterin aldolase/2-amino-4-hydroxy-6-hydroxymethyldihydropteridine diphosphokinase [Rarobacter faecitabidus]
MTADTIRLQGLRAFGYHGVLEEEKLRGQEFLIDVEAALDTQSAAQGDDLARTVDYGALATAIVQQVGAQRFDLIETLGEHLAALVLENPLVSAVTVTVHKPSAPIDVPFADVSVTIRRDRAHPPVSVPVRRESVLVDESSVAIPPPPAPEPPLVPPVLPVGAALPPVPPAPHSPQAGDLPSAPRREPVRALLALGANLGDPVDVLRQAVRELATTEGIAVTAVGPLARTAPVGGPADQPDYFNTVVSIITTHAPHELLAITQGIEADYGRVREVRWGPRTLDIDLITYGDIVMYDDTLELPHPRAHERSFVLLPWVHIEPDAYLHGLGGGPVDVLARNAPDRDGIRTLSLDWFATDTLPSPEHVLGTLQQGRS